MPRRPASVAPRARHLPALALLSLLGGCLLDPFGLHDDAWRPGPLARLDMRAWEDLIEVGDSTTVVATGFDADGRSVLETPVRRWTVSDTTIARIGTTPPWNEATRVIMSRPGRVVVTAQLGSVSGTVALRSIPALAPLELRPAALTMRPGDSTTVRLVVTTRDDGASVDDLPALWVPGGGVSVRLSGYTATLTVPATITPRNTSVRVVIGRRDIVLPIRIVPP